MKIAILDNDTTVSSILNSAGYQTISFGNAKEMSHATRSDQIAMFVLNWSVTTLRSTQSIVWIRENFPPTLPILLVTNPSNEGDIVEALSRGATDFIIKPLRRNELLTRINVLLWRAYPEQFQPEKWEFGPYVFDMRSARLTLFDQLIELTEKELRLALLLFQNLGRPLSRVYLLEKIWLHEPEIPSRTLDTHISRVRTKLQLRVENGFQLVPVYGYGYRLEKING
jgi:DNA-binding response OmpR family regulator